MVKLCRKSNFFSINEIHPGEAGAAPRRDCIPHQCPRCQLIQEMKRIPAKHIPHKIRMELSMILDPPRELPDRDYRYFADRNSVSPQTVQYLDSQKVMGDTSSTCKLLKYLIELHGNAYTVFSVYKTLCDMRSEGQSVIENGMQEIRIMHNQGSRPGQEHSEPSSMATAPQVSLSRSTNNDPPPPYTDHDMQQSLHMSCRASGFQQNNLGIGSSSPQENSDSYTNGGPGESRVQNIHATADRQPGPCEDSFPSSVYIPSRGTDQSRTVSRQPKEFNRLLSPAEAEENSCEFNNSTMSSQDSRGALPTFPPSYQESQLQHFGIDMPQPCQQSPTDMEILKLPLNEEDLVVQEPMDLSQLSTIPQSPDYLSLQKEGQRPKQGQLLQMNIPPELDSLENVVPRGKQLSLHSTQSLRPTSYPTQQRLTYTSRKSQNRPVSDGSFCSHSGACNCNNSSAGFCDLGYGDQQYVSSLMPSSDVSWTTGEFSQISSLSWFAPSSVSSDESVIESPLNGSYHHTDVKQPLFRGDGENVVWIRQYSSMPQNHSQTADSMLESLPETGKGVITLQSERGTKAVQTEDGHSMVVPGKNNSSRGQQPQNGSRSRSYYFVFILGGDIEDNERLKQQVNSLSMELQKRRVPHVAVTSDSDWPLVWLPEHIKRKLPALTEDVHSRQKFMQYCFKKASKVLMLISPGYLRYADEYTEGAERADSLQQKLIRRFHEKLKEEFFDTNNSKVFRVWPVILLGMKAIRVHLPKFLIDALYYCFPSEEHHENLISLLQKECEKSVTKHRIN